MRPGPQCPIEKKLSDLVTPHLTLTTPTLVTTLLHSRQLLTNCGHRAPFPGQNLLTLIKLRPLHVHVLSESITESLMTLPLSCKLMMPIIPTAMF